MINNAKNFMPTFKCRKILGNYLIYEKKFPVLDVDENYYYFLHDDALKETLKLLPLWLRFLKVF